MIVWDKRGGLIIKSKDYVYGIWVYKILGIWKGYYRVKESLVSCMKPWTEARNNDKYMKSHCKLTYQLILKCEPKGGLSCRRQVVHPRHQTPQWESVAKPETPLLIILSIACKYEVHGNLFSPLFEKQSLCRQKHPREVVKNRKSIPNMSQYITS